MSLKKIPSTVSEQNPGLVPVLSGDATTFLDGTGVFSTPAGSDSSAQLHGIMRFLGDGSTTAFNLSDFAEYLEHVGVNGSFADPAIDFALSANRDQIIFTVAPGAGEVVTLEYVTATL